MQRKFKKAILFFIPIAIILYFVIGNIFYYFALNAESSQSRTIGEKAYVPSPAIDAKREELEREKDRVFLDTITPEQLTITSHDDLTLKGYVFEQNNLNKWVFSVHGYTGSVRQMTRWNRQVYELGYNIFAPDLRGHGESEGSFYGMGWLDQQDLQQWLTVLLEREQDANITLYGVSMGASTVLNLAADAPRQVTSVIADSGFTSVNTIFETQLRNVFHLPSFPIINAANTVSKIRIGLDFDEASTINKVSAIRVPILYIHGGIDTFVPVENVHELAAATNAVHEVWIVEEANHGEAVKVEPDLYREKIEQFIEGHQ
ncbi:MAG: alpha/beta fold hydrolase [Lysinibacillus sp.]